MNAALLKLTDPLKRLTPAHSSAAMLDLEAVI